MLVDGYLRSFLLSGGNDPYPVNEFDKKEQIKERKHTYEKHKVGVDLTDDKLEGKHCTSTVKRQKLKEWYVDSDALACMIDSDCFAYVDNKLCVCNRKYLDRDENGRFFITQYAKEHEEECFLQFVVDNETGELHYLTLPKSLACKSFSYYDELSRLSDDEKLKLGLVSEISKEMLGAIGGLEFGEALTKLMSDNICHCSVRTLKSQTGLDNTTISNLKKGHNLNKSNVISACLGIHVPSRVSKRMLQLAEITLDVTIPGKKGEENDVYSQILHLNWAMDYSDTYDELKENNYEYLIHQPPL
jgi:type I restriction enzyme R subunit